MDALSSVTAWLVSAMLAWSPTGRSHIEEARETEEEGKARYGQIATALVKVAYDPANTPIFSGDKGRARTAMLMLSTAYFESGFRKDVDLGTGKLGRGDFGKSHCMMQINIGRNRKNTAFLLELIGKAWTPDDLVEDRTKCFFAGYKILYKSFQSCRKLPIELRLAAYASGKCEEGHAESTLRVTKAQRRFGSHKPPYKDVEVLKELAVPPSGSAARAAAVVLRSDG